MNIFRLILLILLIIICIYIINKNIENYTGYNRKDNMYQNLKSYEKKKDVKEIKKIKLDNGINIELGSDNYKIEETNNEINIKNYIDNRVEHKDLVNKEGLFEGIRHIYNNFNEHHNRSCGFFY